ncbi:TPA: dinitrogenase iron-molybdenum cofactor biosynthesis protein [Candidatus Poribacteria bacterium]|nr:dinitrogenase iron-molybdenum cofactor biosynthesis protein [Candidatus Poribacteria bacterium]
MKVAVSAMGTDMNAQVDPRFGRCANFIIVDTDTMEFETMQNPYITAGGGAGIQSAQLVANKGAQAVLTGNCGPNAFQTLSAAGVQVITGVSGTVRSAVERYKSGQFQPTAQANVPEYFGRGGMQQPGMGMGRGGGMGMGRGMGRGMRRGGMGGGPPFSQPMQQPPMPPQQPMNASQELQMLKEQAKGLQQQLEQINQRIKQLEE